MGVYSGSIETAFDQIGEYYITFRFNLSENVINYYTNEYIRKGQDGLHLKRQVDFVLKYLTETRFQDCFSDCRTARSKLGTKADFTAMFIDKLKQLGESPAFYENLISTTYDNLLIQIIALEANCNNASPCDVYKEPMLTDVSPGGQYAMVDQYGTPLENATNVLQLYFKKGAFDNLSKTDAVYIQNEVTKDDGSVSSPYDSSFTLADLIKYWRAEWAEQFLKFHPEYCKLQFCINHSGDKQWDDRLKEIDKASVMGYNRNNALTWLLNTDPFFKNPAYSTYKSDMEFELANFSVVKTGRSDITVKNIYSFIDFILYCADIKGTTNKGNTSTQNWDNCIPSSECRVEDREWQLYRDYYLQLKTKYIEIVRNIETCTGSFCPIGKPISVTDNDNNTENCSKRILPEGTEPLAGNSYRTFDYNKNQQTTYSYISGSADVPPGSNCNGIVSKKFYPCIQVSISSGGKVVYTNVWEVSCMESAYCPPESSITADGLGYSSDFYVTSPSYRYDYSFYEGYDKNNAPLTGCYGGGENNITTYYDCFTVYYSGSTFTYYNVWVSVCVTYLGYNGGGSGGGGGQPEQYPEQSYAMEENEVQAQSSPTSISYSTVCAKITDSPNFDDPNASKYINCYGWYFHNPRKIIVELVDQNGKPVSFHKDVQVNVKFSVGQQYYPSTEESVIISIPNGKTSETYFYDSTFYIEERNCSAYQKTYLNQNTISGASFCSPSVGPANCPAIYAKKISRFDPIIIPPATEGTEEQYRAEQNAALANQIETACMGNADGWIQRLRKGLDAGGYTQEKIDELRNNLINLCIQGGDIKHPFGASSLPVGVSITIGGYNATNFGEVLKYTLGIQSFTDLLNPWLIDAPYPYDVAQQPTEKVIPATSETICNKLAALRPPGYSDQAFFTFLKAKFENAMNLNEAEFNTLLKGCTNCKYLLDYNLKLPVFLDDGATGCINRGTYNTAMSNLNAAFGGDLNASWSNYETIVSNYLNQRFGFFFSFRDYEIYAESNRDQLCNEPAYVAAPEDYYACAKNLIDLAYGIAYEQYLTYIAEERKKFVNAYVNTCATAKANVTLKASQQLYHFTLYYYDLAGNLVRTVPPEGVVLLNDNEIKEVSRNRDGLVNESCDYNGPLTASDRNTALQSLSTALQGAGNNAIEMWLYAGDPGARQFIAVTPDMKYMLQACQNGNLINVDIFTIKQTAASNVAITLSNHVTADVSSILPLQPWSHIVVQGADLGKGALQIWINGKQYTPLTGAPTAGCGWAISTNASGNVVMPDNFALLKYLRIYNKRLMTGDEIAKNANSPCFGVVDVNNPYQYRFNVPEAGGNTTIAANSTQETQFSGIYPAHVLTTTYTYNATNQVVQQNTPDAGTSKFWYDKLSRLTASQNGRQAPAGDYSYTNYDALGRITEVGQKRTNLSVSPGYLSDNEHNSFLSSGSNSQITTTVYDAQSTISGSATGLTQNNLRKRVAASIYRENSYDANFNATYYNYDLAGNVKTLYQQVKGLGLKRIDYEYDLISGKVNFLAYQHGQNDAFYYEYKYDAENRLTSAWSSTQANVVNYGFGSTLLAPSRRLDASYQYYLHGPLARMELGREGEKVQGVDYAYTLQGWLKGVNGSSLHNPSQEIGNDAATIAKDALAYSLGYYTGDYTPIGAGTAFAHNFQGNNSATGGRNLYNGNIASSTYAIAQIENGATKGYSYGYDQLNRLKTFRQHDLGAGGNWDFNSASQKFKEDFSYDANGNILSLQRQNQNGSTMDKLGYVYNRDASGKLLNNRLAAVNDAVGVTNGNDMGNTSYSYDETGNLKTDAAAGITNIDWTVYGKIKSISKTGNGNIAYTYDASGNRVSKLVDNVSTFYVRDAQGNSLAVYDNAGNTTNWREQQLYGSSRLGMWKPNLNLATANGSSVWNNYGNKFFELSNHLGNVMAVINDNRLQAGSNYEPNVINSNDYYAFGGQMPGRSYTNTNASAYRYGFNGKENDNEVKGEGNQQDYGMRIYDPRVGRFLSVDPITAKYPELTPYQFASNSPIFGIDLDGLEIANPQMLLRKKYPVITGIADGIEASINKTWNFFKPGGDAYKANTYKQGVLFLEEVALSSSPVSDIYKPNTPKLDAMVDNLDKELLKGDSYSRTKYVSEFGTDLLSAYVGSKGLGKMGSLAGESFSAISKGLFTVNPSKFDYFFGRVVSGAEHNVVRSAQNLKDLTTLGIKTEKQLMGVFKDAIKKGTVASTKTNEFGTSVMRTVNVGNKGSIDVGFFYEKGNMSSTPSVTTIIPKIAK